MAGNTQSSQQQNTSELLKRIEWMDEQRRKSARKLAELEQRFTIQDRKLATREDRIQDLERQLANTTVQLTRISEIDVQLAKFRDEMVDLIEQYDRRRVQGEQEMDRLRRVEHETVVREISEVRKELPVIGRLEREMELRQAEDTRLANLIGILQNGITPIRNQVAEWEQAATFLEEKEKQNSQDIGEIQTQLLELNKKWDPINARIEVLAHTLSKAESSRQDLIDAQVEQRDIVKKWSEQIQIGEHERNKQLEKWRYVLEEQKDIMSRYSQEWVGYSDQYQEAKMALQTFSEWQKQIESHQRESSDLLKMELNRIQSRWDGFILKDEQKWRSSQAEMEQRWKVSGRSEKQVQEQILELEGALVKIQEDKDMLWRVQTAQADAIKLIPRVWLEEIDKAIAQNPNRRRQPTMVPVREE
jgi:chromosome segregation ATPase